MPTEKVVLLFPGVALLFAAAVFRACLTWAKHLGTYDRERSDFGRAYNGGIETLAGWALRLGVVALVAGGVVWVVR